MRRIHLLHLRNLSSLTTIAFLLLTAVGIARAQDEEARKFVPHALGGPFIVYRDKVQEELKLSDDQKRKLLEKLPDFAPATVEAFEKFKDLKPRERETALEPHRRKSRERFAALLKETLRAEQLDRLKQLQLQHEGPAALGRPEIRKELKITNEQWKQVMSVIQGLQKELETLMIEARSGGNPRGILARAIKIREDHEKKVEAILSDAQKKQWGAMRGRPVDVLTD